jgi:hypothetical protein
MIVILWEAEGVYTEDWLSVRCQVQNIRKMWNICIRQGIKNHRLARSHSGHP